MSLELLFLMASSGSYNSTPGRRISESQLLQELEALSQSLHMFQQPLALRRTGYLSQPIAKKLHTREEHGARDEAMSLPGLAANSSHHSTAPTASRNFRHSMAHPRPAKSNVMDVKATRFSASATSGINSEKVDIRGRRNQYSPSPLPMPMLEESNLRDDNKNILQADDEKNLGFSKKIEHKKLGFWAWKPIRALSHIGMERFSCVFSVYVNDIHGLSPSVNGLRLTVSLRKKESRDGAVQTMPARVFQSVAEFDETLRIKCHVYGSSSSHGSNNSQGFLKFQSRLFTISVVAIEEKEVDFGKHNVDLSMLLQESLQKKSAGKDCGDGWNASFALRGNGRGAELVVGLGFEILEKGARYQIGSCRFKEYSDQADRASTRISKSLPSSSRGTPKTIGATGFPNAYGSDSLFQSPMIRDYPHDIIRIAHLNIDDPPSPEPELQSQNGRAERGS